MADLLKEVSSEPCSSCGNPIGRTHVNLSRNEERLSEPGSDLQAVAAVVDVAHGELLSSYCMACGVDAACKDLQELGVLHHEEKRYVKTCLCAICGKARIELHEWHCTYVIGIDEFDGECFNTLETPLIAVACEECEAKRSPT